MPNEIVLIVEMRWWSDASDEVHPDHFYHLRERGLDIARMQIRAGMREGELQERVKTLETDPEDGAVYRGYWRLQET